MDTLQLIIEAIDRTEAAISKADSNLDKMASSTARSQGVAQAAFSDTNDQIIALNQGLEILRKGFSLISGAVSLSLSQFSDLAGASFDLVESYDAQARGVTQLESVLQAQGAFTEELSQEYQDLASSWQDVSRVGDEELLPQMARLSAFIGTNVDEMNEATGAALDLSAAFGSSLDGAYSKLIKAVSSGTLELAEGVSVQLEATSVSGRLAEAIEFVNSRFGGTAKAIADIGSGPIISLLNLVTDLKEGLGETISQTPEFQAFLDTAEGVVRDLIQLLEEDGAGAAQLFGALFQASFEVAATSGEALVGVIFGVVEAIANVSDVLGSLPFVDSPFDNLKDRFERDTGGLIEIARSLPKAIEDAQFRDVFSGFDPTQLSDGAQEALEIISTGLGGLASDSEATAEEIREIAASISSIDPSILRELSLDPDQLEEGAAELERMAQSLSLIDGAGIEASQDAVSRLLETLREGDFASSVKGILEGVDLSFQLNSARRFTEQLIGVAEAGSRAAGGQRDFSASSARAATDVGATTRSIVEQIQALERLGGSASGAGAKIESLLRQAAGLEVPNDLADPLDRLGVKASGLAVELEKINAAARKIQSSFGANEIELNVRVGSGLTELRELLVEGGAHFSDLAGQVLQGIAADIDRAGASSSELDNELQAIGASIKTISVAGIISQIESAVGVSRRLADAFQSIKSAAASLGADVLGVGDATQSLSSRESEELAEFFKDAGFSAAGAQAAIRALGGEIDSLPSSREIEIRVTSDAAGQLSGELSGAEASADSLGDSLRDLGTASESLRTGSNSARDLDSSLQQVRSSANSARSAVSGLATEAAKAARAVDLSFETQGSTTARGTGLSVTIESGDLDAAADAIQSAATKLEEAAGELSLAGDSIESSAQAGASELSNAASSAADALFAAASEIGREAAAQSQELSRASSELSSAGRALQQAAAGRGGDQEIRFPSRLDVVVVGWSAGVLPVRTQGASGQAAGGIVTMPTFIEAGEGSSPEGVIPLDDRGVRFMSTTMQRAISELGVSAEGLSGRGGVGGGGTHLHLHADRIELNPEALSAVLFDLRTQLADEIRNKVLLGA